MSLFFTFVIIKITYYQLDVGNGKKKSAPPISEGLFK